MSNFLRTGFAAIALTFFFGTFAATETNAQINEVLKRMDTYYAKLKTLRSDIRMVKYNDNLKVTEDSDIYEGELMYVPAKGRNAYVRIDWSKPLESFSVVDKKYVIYRPRLKQALTGNVDNAKGSAGANSPLSFINMSKAQLKANFDIKYLGQETINGGTLTWHLELTPKKGVKYKTSDIWVNGNGLPVQIKITENNKDSTTILLTNVDDRSDINMADFNIKLPSDTKLVK
jgi:outer membrane lipoprotein-sorting protein